MAFAIPTLTDLLERTRQAFRSNLKGSDAWLWPNNINPSAKVIAGAVWEAFGYLDYIARQRFVTEAEGRWLDMHGKQYDLPRLEASFAQGAVRFTATPGTAVPAGLSVSRVDNITYEVTVSAIADIAGVLNLTVRAQQAGSAGNAIPGTGVSLSQNIDGVDPSGEVAPVGIGLGADLEQDEAYRARLLHRLRFPPHGGAAHDYVAWAREVNGVSRVFVEPLQSGPGTVGVYFLMDGLYPNGIPQAADVAKVAEFIAEVRPVTAIVTVRAPTPVPVDITITGLSPDTTETRNAIAAELADMFYRDAKVGTQNDGCTLHVSKIWAAISQAAGEDFHTLSTPAEDLNFSGGELPVLGTITYS